ncbi:ubiquinone-binding protein [Pseudoalteromonas sp. NBT06-2]|uniref:type II toxin-antitoxin system RatA family toxin n=1 Tax=Pseudoalteromonas sp. NBT06-2 TaxID=2025950 RepID=UPI000BA6899B|nr:type II toxin-antitoxin system RatA family toxin [Pseudoalteromonas sp. NBT06-2]PAJ75601.1 ubiquinone-binding protein [Pseudoalteromonas sp. NBT06-2]
MPEIKKSALVMYSASEMFTLVNDVAYYREFLPHCSDAKIISQSDDKMTASVEISKGGLKKWFTTENTLLTDKKINMVLVDGPFKKLEGGWLFTPLDETACKVELKLNFEFSSRLVEIAFGRVFNEVANNMLGAFTQRAKQVYGQRGFS